MAQLVVTGGDDLDLSEQDDGHVHTADHEQLPEGAEDGHDDEDAEATHVSQTEEGVGNDIADLVADRGEDDEGDGDGDDHGAERGEDRGEHVGHDLLEELLNEVQNGHRQDDRQDGLLIVGRGDLDTVDGDDAGAAVGSSAHDGRGHEGAAEEHTQDRGGAELLGRGVAQVDGDEGERRLVQGGVEERVGRVGVGQDAEHGGAEDGRDGAEQTAGHEQRDQLGHGARQIVEDDVGEVLDLELLLGRVEVLLDLLALLDAGDGDELGKHLGHVLADDDLELAAGELATQDALDLLDGLDVGLAVVLERETQARHAVGGDGDVLRTANEPEDVDGNLLVIYCHGTPPHIHAPDMCICGRAFTPAAITPYGRRSPVDVVVNTLFTERLRELSYTASPFCADFAAERPVNGRKRRVNVVLNVYIAFRRPPFLNDRLFKCVYIVPLGSRFPTLSQKRAVYVAYKNVLPS